MNASEIKQLIESGLPGANVKVLGDDGQHFEAYVQSEAFACQRTIADDRMVYATLGDSFENVLHALALKTSLPDS